MDDAAAREWAEREFSGVNLGNKARTRRLVDSAAKIAAYPERPFTQVFDWNGLRGFYRVCNQKTATLAAIQGPHWQHTREAMGQHPLVLVLHDTTELDFTGHHALKGAGPIGDGNGRGFLQHNSLAIVPGCPQVLGLAFQQWLVREEAPEGETAAERKKRKKREKRQRESQLWMNGIRATGTPPQGCRWVDVGDRGADIYEAMRAAGEVQHDFLFRVTQNRTVWVTPEQTEKAKLKDFAASLPAQGCDTIEIPTRGGRPGRVATVQLAGAPVWIPAPAGTPQRWSQPVIAAWVIRIWEPDPPKDVEALHWILVCSVASRTLEELKERRDWYAFRWLVEIFHNIEKNGCSEQDRRFETAARMEACLAILSLTAVRIFQLRTALDAQPNEPAEQVASTAEIEVVKRYLGTKAKELTVAQFVRAVAKLGGFLGRKRDGNPGVRTLWRGYQRLQDMLLGYQLRPVIVAASGELLVIDRPKGLG